MPATPNKLTINLSKNNYNVFGIKSNNQNADQQQEQKDELLKGKRGNQKNFGDKVDYINLNGEDQMEIYGYEKDKCCTAIIWFLIIITGGLLRLIFHWFPHLMLLATHSRCSLEDAETVLLVEKFQGKHTIYHVKRIKTIAANEVWNVYERSINEKSSKSANEPCGEAAKIEQKDQSEPPKLTFHLTGGQFREISSMLTFTCKKFIYIWDTERCEFSKLQGLDLGVPTSSLHQMRALSALEQAMRRGVYGNNEIVIPIKSFISLAVLEVLNPFYVFQIFSFILWICDDYIYYAMVILFMSSCGIIMAAVQTQKNQENLRSTVSSSDVATVLRDRSSGATESVAARCLVPGDVIVIPSYGCTMPCDAVLLTGNCILNESMLTGESVPITKTPIPSFSNIIYDTKEHARHTLFCGTRILQTRYFGNEMVLAVVIRTGFNTIKGGLVRSIMYPAPVDFKFEQDSYKFVEILACVASIGVVHTVVTKMMRGVALGHIIIEALDLITIVVPPALPAAMTVGRLVAQNRLKKKKMYCTSPRAINVSGSIDCVCFDKTGTLTEDGLDMWGVVTVSSRKFQLPIKDISKLPLNDVLIGMVTCHSITIIDGQLIGDPLDLKMFESTGWILEEPDVSDTSKFSMLFPTIVRPPQNRQWKLISGKLDSVKVVIKNQDDSMSAIVVGQGKGVEIGIVRQFAFTSTLQRMSVITRTLGADHYDLYCKGSPEMIHSLSIPESIPEDFNSILQEYTAEGYRVIALAHKSLKKLPYAKVQRITREVAEADLIFLGFVVLENRLKPQTTPVISALNEANIKVVMVTGDNMLTALSVARDCGIIRTGVPVIAVSAFLHNHSEKPIIYFTRGDVHNNRSQSSKTPEGDFSEVTDINSIISMETIESNAGNNYQGDFGNYFSYDLNRQSKVTGDNVPTKKNQYVFSLTGKTWALVKHYYPELIPKLATRGTVFARMSPDQKQHLVQELQALGYYVAMVGDGANDCGALKAAHTGISLSDTESSVASPFTSRETNISCVLTVIREGRAALVTSFGIFKYMAAYSLTQFISVMLLYGIESNLTDIEFLYIDLFIISIFAFFFGKTKAYEGPLVKKPPLTSLLSATPILSLTGQILIVSIFQYLSLWSLQQMTWYQPFNATAASVEMDEVGCHENYAIFIMSSIQYIILAVVFSKGRPYRNPIYTNYGLLASFILLSAFSVFLSFNPFPWLADWFELVVPEELIFRLIVLLLGLANFVLAIFVEYFLVDYVIYLKLRSRLHNIEKSRKRFLVLERDMVKSKDWPSISPEPVPEVIVTPDSCLAIATTRPNQVITEIKIEKQLCGTDDFKNGSYFLPSTRKFYGSDTEVSLNPRNLCEKSRAAGEEQCQEPEDESDFKRCIRPYLNGSVPAINEAAIATDIIVKASAVVTTIAANTVINTNTKSVQELDELPS